MKQYIHNSIGWLALAEFMGLIVLTQYYQATRTEFPESKLGRIYELNEHGRIVYLTLPEHCLVLFLFLCPLVLIILGFMFFTGNGANRDE